MPGSRLLAPLAAIVATTWFCSDAAPARPEETERSVLRLEQSTRGIPRRGKDGSRDTKTPIRQVLWLDADGRRVRLEQYAKKGDRVPEAVYVIELSVDRQDLVTREFPRGAGRYKERRGDFNDHQKKRRIRERELLRKIATYPRAERDEALKSLHLRADGRRIVNDEWTDAPTRLGHECRRLLVAENDRVVLEADIARPPAGAFPAEGRGYFEMYRRLGVFSEEVIERLRKLEGIPLYAEITVVTDLAPYTLTVEVEKLEQRKVPATFFDVPPDAEKIPDVPPISVCPVCSSEFETENAGGRLFYEGRTIHVCGAQCFRKLDEKLNGRRRRR